ncbi:kinase-like domain-containing protein, partial [Suillus cothurnatus]
TTLASDPEKHRETSGAQDDLGIFDADDIRYILKEMDYNISFIVFGVFQIWPVQGGNVISMPMAGSHLASLYNPTVDFMHQHGVVHLDLKPPNVLLPTDGGRLSIISFNRSVHVKGTEHMFHGVVGTTGYLAPEVAAGQGPYSAIRADLWSCGKTLEELCSLCRSSKDCDMLLEIAQELMNEDPKQLAYYKDNVNTGPVFLLSHHQKCTLELDSLVYYVYPQF